MAPTGDRGSEVRRPPARRRAGRWPGKPACPPVRRLRGCWGRWPRVGHGRASALSRARTGATLHSPEGLRHLRNQRARREVELASVRDCHDDPHRRSHTGGAHSSSRLAPVSPTPVAPVMNLTARVGVPRPKTPPERFVRKAASRRRRVRRTLGRHGAGLPGACPAPPASPGSHGCQPRSASARWRPPRSSLLCPGAGCRSG